MITHTKLPISFDLDKLSLEGRVENFDFNTETLKLLADRFQIVAIENFKGQFQITPTQKHFMLVVTYQAKVFQACVVTDEAVEDDISESFDVRLEPSAEPDDLPMDEETMMNEEDTEYVPERTVDVGDLMAQYLATALNPFPRKGGAEFEQKAGKGAHVLSEEEDKETRNPFSVLKKLQDKG